MSKRQQSTGNSSRVSIDKPILMVTPETELAITTDGVRQITTPIRTDAGRASAIERAQARTLKTHAATFRELAK
ncbi:MAG: hypothetical protein Q8N51_14635 [Gammaproteobacteria bacterium]|nr:hypothetical protein [Gammaproteobacteria bacterium]